jgi:uncharacterized membrane protein YuzA (DUF378 family)
MGNSLAIIFLFVGMFLFSLMTMCWGWGLEIKSLGWILGGWFGILCCSALIQVVSKEK